MKKKVKKIKYEVKKDSFIKNFLKKFNIDINLVVIVGLVVVFLFSIIVADSIKGVNIDSESGELASMNPISQLSFFILIPVVLVIFLSLVYLIKYFVDKH